MYSTYNYPRYSNRLLLCWCIYCLAEWFSYVPPAPYGHNTAAVGPLLSSGVTAEATYTCASPQYLCSMPSKMEFNVPIKCW